MKKLLFCCALVGVLFSAEASTKAVVKTSFGEIELEKAKASCESVHTVTVSLTDEEMAMLQKMRGGDAAEKLRNAIHDQTGGVFVLCRFDLKADADRSSTSSRKFPATDDLKLW